MYRIARRNPLPLLRLSPSKGDTSPTQKSPRAEGSGTRPLIFLEDLLAQPDRFRRDLDELIVPNELNGLFEIHHARRHQANGLVRAVDERIFVSFFSLTMFTFMSVERAFSPTIIPS